MLDIAEAVGSKAALMREESQPQLSSGISPQEDPANWTYNITAERERRDEARNRSPSSLDLSYNRAHGLQGGATEDPSVQSTKSLGYRRALFRTVYEIGTTEHMTQCRSAEWVINDTIEPIAFDYYSCRGRGVAALRAMTLNGTPCLACVTLVEDARARTKATPLKAFSGSAT